MSVLYSEDFAGTAALGANWASNAGTPFTIVSGVAVPAADPSWSYVSSVTPPADQYAKILTNALAGDSDSAGPAVRIATGAESGYFLEMAGSVINITKAVAGSYSAVSASDDSQPNSQTVELHAVGTDLYIYKAGVEVHNASDASLSSGRFGLFGYPRTDNYGADTFEGGSFSSAPNVVAHAPYVA